jgi:exodeoxyribonuclease VII small subunit
MVKKGGLAMNGLNYEQAFAELEAVVAALEEGRTSLEESLKLFERGQALSSRCAELLKKAELTVTELNKDAEERV